VDRYLACRGIFAAAFYQLYKVRATARKHLGVHTHATAFMGKMSAVRTIQSPSDAVSRQPTDAALHVRE
jgi:hypothetical protein